MPIRLPTREAAARLDLDRLTPQQLAELHALLAHERDAEGLERFIVRVAPHQPPPKHIRAFVAELERAREGPIRLCVSMPPGHAKSITLFRAFCWWMQEVAPADMNAYATYNEKFALSQSRKIQRVAEAAGIEFEGGQGEWHTAQGGGLIAVGREGGLVGRRIHGLLVVDDIFKDRIEANSALIRQNVYDWFREVAETRLENASVIVVQTRWHEDDLIGRLAETGEYKVINFPALAEENDPLGRTEGEALWPDLYPKEFLEKKRADAYAFAALYQGRPRPRGKNIFGPAHYFDRKTTDLNGCVAIVGADPAASEKTSADWSVAVALAVRRGRTIDDHQVYVLGVYRAQVSVPQFARDLRAFQVNHWNAPVAVESVGGFKSVPQILREQAPGINVTEIHPAGDKFLRAQPLAAAWNSGRVFVPMDAPWVEAFVNELQAFTGVKDVHDDQVDAASHAFNFIVGGPAPVRRGAVAQPERWR